MDSAGPAIDAGGIEQLEVVDGEKQETDRPSRAASLCPRRNHAYRLGRCCFGCSTWSAAPAKGFAQPPVEPLVGTGSRTSAVLVLAAISQGKEKRR